MGEKPLLLLTNVENNDDSIYKTIVKCYLMCWKIEEFYRFKKQVFHFESICVLRLKSMNNLNFLLNPLIGFLAMKFTDRQDKPIIIAHVNQGQTRFCSYKKRTVHRLRGLLTGFLPSRILHSPNPILLTYTLLHKSPPSILWEVKPNSY
jgi:hypothetical protein